MIKQIAEDNGQEERTKAAWFLVAVGLPAESPFVARVVRNRSRSITPCLLITQASGELG